MVWEPMDLLRRHHQGQQVQWGLRDQWDQGDQWHLSARVTC